MGTAVITCCDTPPVLQFAERIFNEVPTFIQRFVERKGCISGFPRRYAGRHTWLSEISATSILSVRQKCAWKAVQHELLAAFFWGVFPDLNRQCRQHSSR